MDAKQAVKMLESVAARGFCSEPVQHWLDKNGTEQVATFTDDEKSVLRAFLGANPHLSRIGRHSIPSFFGEGPSKTISLLGRISYAMNGDHISPDYVSGLAAELDESLHEFASLWETRALEKMMD